MSSHPGSTLNSAIALAEYLKASGQRPEQVQDFYPTPGTLSTCMFYTGLDPRTMKPVYVPVSPEEKAMQRALMQFFIPKNRPLVRKALRLADRDDLIGSGRNCLVPDVHQSPAHSVGSSSATKAITVRSMERRNIRQSNEKMRGRIPVSVPLNRAAASGRTAEFKAKKRLKHPISVQAQRSIADVCKACVSILRPLPRSVGILHRFVL